MLLKPNYGERYTLQKMNLQTIIDPHILQQARIMMELHKCQRGNEQEH